MTIPLLIAHKIVLNRQGVDDSASLENRAKSTSPRMRSVLDLSDVGIR